jgi:PAS domain S-box-containing protein
MCKKGESVGRVIKNIKTGKEIIKPDPIDEEVPFDGGVMITETDLAGIITYANRRFVEISGYTKEELIGSPHCIHLHPHMPEIIFKYACRVTSEGKTWSGYMCNISKEGIGYWTELIMQPKKDENGEVTGFMATRRAPNADELENVMEEYEQLKASGNDNATSQYCGEVFTGRGSGQL